MAKITKECVQLAIERIKDSFNDQPSPKVRYDNHTKKISVIHDFCFGKIPKIKMIASREQWFELYYDIYQHTFDSIQGFLYRPTKQKREDLKEYAEGDLERFRDDLLIYVAAAHMINPIQYFRKGKYFLNGKRKSSHYDLSQREKYEVANMATRLYEYLRNIRKISSKQWPFYFKRFLKQYEISPDGLKKNTPNVALQEEAGSVLIKYYGLDPSDRFWQTFVTESPILLRRIHKLNRAGRINPEEDPFLKELFKEFMD
jgi:hypothetical protein